MIAAVISAVLAVPPTSRVRSPLPMVSSMARYTCLWAIRRITPGVQESRRTWES
jgi:hypothetical protein